jgi:hypothetical protein
MIELAADVPIEAALSRWTARERRTLGGVLGFLAGLSALGPVAALGAAVLGALAAKFADPR